MPRRTEVVVATTVLLSFISFWRVAAIVLCDLGSSAFYVGGIAEEAIGRSAPWFVLGVMLFSYAVRAVYVESCGMFTRGGVYRVVKEAMGGVLAKLSVSALMFDYILTGPISGVSAGQYLAGLISTTLQYLGRRALSSGQMNLIAIGLALAITLYFWWQNIKGIHESSERALRIMQITTVMVVLVIGWSLVTIAVRGASLPPLPTLEHIRFSEQALGWLKGTALPNIAPIAILVGLGHAVLAMSGEESLAQVNREIEYPKTKNLLRAGLVIFAYSLLFTSLVSFFAAMIIPDQTRPEYFDNLISGLAMYFVGPISLRLLFQGFVVFVGFLMLAGAVNTAIVGSNGVLTRVSEDGVLTDWFRAPHKRFGTTHRLINLVVLLQVFTILVSGGRVYILGEAYAFGVIWSFAFKALAVLVLRFTQPGARAWRVPLNLRLGTLEVPLGLGLITLALFAFALANLFTKQVATISGLVFTGVFFAVFTVSERRFHQRHPERLAGLDQFQLREDETVSPSVAAVRPGCVLVPVRDHNTLQHLEHALEKLDTTREDVVVLTVRVMRNSAGAEGFYGDELFGRYEQTLFTRVVAVAERLGKHANLLVVPSNDVFQGIAQTAFRLEASRIVSGVSSVMTPDEQSLRLGRAWDQIPGSAQRRIVYQVVHPGGQVKGFYLGPHMPELTMDDLVLIHNVWLAAGGDGGAMDVHHRDIVLAGLRLLEEELTGPRREEIIRLINGCRAGGAPGEG